MTTMSKKIRKDLMTLLLFVPLLLQSCCININAFTINRPISIYQDDSSRCNNNPIAAAMCRPRRPLFSTSNNDYNNISELIMTMGDDKEENELLKAVNISSNLLYSLRRGEKISSAEESSTTLLDLETDFYDPSTGLHSEGIWHNCLVGIASLKLLKLSKKLNNKLGKKVKSESLFVKKIAESLWKYSWDGTSFQRRVHSGLWDHSKLNNNDTTTIHQSNYYKESKEHRCIQHGMAVIFWSMLVRHFNEKKEDNIYNEQYKVISKSFLREFWDEDTKRWLTISRTQGGGTVQRASASSGEKARATENISNDNTSLSYYYYRAVDQAVACLACLSMLQQEEQIDIAERLKKIIQTTCQELLSSNAFGYGDEKTTRSYIGLDRNRNFWHDGWVMLALLYARDFIIIDNHKKDETTAATQKGQSNDNDVTINILRPLLLRLIDRYGKQCDENEPLSSSFDGTVWHWSKAFKDESGNVRYCGNNALLYCILRNWPEEDRKNLPVDFFNKTAQFWNFVNNELQLSQEANHPLVCVADVYPIIRLHPNTELASLVVWQKSDFI